MRFVIAFKNSRTKNIWVKSFRTKASAKRAAAAIIKKTSNQVADKKNVFRKSIKNIQMEPAKGFKYGRDLINMNRKKY